MGCKVLISNIVLQRKGAAPLSGAEEQTARAISAYAQCACLISLKFINLNGDYSYIIDYTTGRRRWKIFSPAGKLFESPAERLSATHAWLVLSYYAPLLYEVCLYTNISKIRGLWPLTRTERRVVICEQNNKICLKTL
jgi:hypothetical protein